MKTFILKYSKFIFGVILFPVFVSWYFSSSDKNRELKYLIEKEPRKIFSQTSENIKVTFNGKTILNEIYAQRIYFWNNGKEAIVKNAHDILVPVHIIPNISDTGYSFIESKIIKKSREDISVTSSLQKDLNLIIDFNFLDYEDGFVIDLMYIANKPVEFKVKGSLKNQKDIENAINRSSTQKTIKYFKIFGEFVIVSLALFGIWVGVIIIPLLIYEIFHPESKMNIIANIAILIFMGFWYPKLINDMVVTSEKNHADILREVPRSLK